MVTFTAIGAVLRAGTTSAADAASSGGTPGLRLGVGAGVALGPMLAADVPALAAAELLRAAAGTAAAWSCVPGPAPGALEGSEAAGAGDRTAPGPCVAGAVGAGGEASGGTAATMRWAAANASAARNPAQIAVQIAR